MDNRWKNYGLWAAIFAFIPLLLSAFGINIIPADYNEIVTAFLGILVLAGILNNPTTENPGFKDDKKIDTKDDTKIDTKK
ncbi:holin [Candidatus Epulonipiscioides gigas]|nr:holin [Epulopiscium sp. SCG-C07WGA-EpuloA2]